MDKTHFKIADQTIARGTTVDCRMHVSETYTGDPVDIPLRVVRARKRGPIVFVTAAIHGDEIAGTGIIHQLMYGEPLELQMGTLLLAPIINPFGFETQMRYMPDRRDLNRSFPGSAQGSLTSRVARRIFEQIVQQCDFGIDLHSAASQRTNFPNVRADLTDKGASMLANAFGCEMTVNGKGPEGSMRRAACKAGCPTIILEAGEPSRFEPSVIQVGERGIRNVLKRLGMLPGEVLAPPYRARVNRTTWVRAEVGGILRLHITPGEIVEAGQPLASNVSVFGEQQNTLRSPVDGIVLGMTTLPTVKPGEPVCHIAVPGRSLRTIRKALHDEPTRSLTHRLRRDLSTGLHLTTHDPAIAEPDPATPGDIIVSPPVNGGD